MNNHQKSRKYIKLLILGTIVVLLIIGGYFIYRYYNHSNNQSSNIQAPISSQNNSPNATKSVSDKNNNSNPDATTTLVAPYGSFVSNHFPNLSESPAPSSLTSVCNTSAGATCQITFTNGSTTKSLPAQSTNSSGYTYWSWNIQDIGLTVGTWKIQATSSYKGQTKTSMDGMNLVVSQ